MEEMPTYNFQGYKGRARMVFTCEHCGKPNRTRTFVAEHTVNPFNKNPDGSVKQASQVMREASAEAKRQRDEFAVEPWCATCEDGLSYDERKALRARRSASIPA